MKKKIHYICNFDNGDSGYELSTRVSIMSKSSYVLNSLVEAGYFVEVHSTAMAKRNGRVKRTIVHYDNYLVEYLFSLGKNNFVLKFISIISIYIQLILIWFCTPKKDVFLLYHSVRYTNFFNTLKCISQRHKLFVEVEEVYSVVYQSNSNVIEKEIRSLQRKDGYILVNENLQRLCNLNGPNAICHGIYLPRYLDSHTINRENVKILYAGELNEDMWLAVEVAKLLPPNMHLIILGYGNDKVVERLNELCVEESKAICASIEYGGCLTGEEYHDFIRGCDVGLCTRVVDGEGSLYAFPSKILAYLSNNLLTISTPLQSILCSKLSQIVHTSSDFSASSLAQTLLDSVEHEKEINYSKLLLSYHESFVCELRLLFSLNG